MRGEKLSERTMGTATLDMLIDYYLGDMQRRVCTEDSVSTNRRALGRFARAVDLNAHPVTLQEATQEIVEEYVSNMQRRDVRFEGHPTPSHAPRPPLPRSQGRGTWPTTRYSRPWPARLLECACTGPGLAGG